MSEKPSLDELNNQELDSLDQLEKNFQRVISELVTERTLDTFRVEYEKIYESFLVSHQHNAQLVDKCRELNSEILANSTKVSSILKLSQDDQRTIAGLRYEFEKAWKMVEMSQERENKSRDLIEQLKLEVNHLTKLAEKGGAMSLTNDSSLQVIQDDVSSLKKEIAMQSKQIESLTRDLKNTTDRYEEMLKESKDFAEQQTVLEKSIVDAKDETLILEAEIEKQIKILTETKDASLKTKKEIEDRVSIVAQKRSSIASLQATNVDHKHSINDVKLLGRDKLNSIETCKVLHDNRKRMNSAVAEEISLLESKIQEKELEYRSLNENLGNIISKLANTRMEVEISNMERQKTEESLRAQHSLMNRLRNEIYKKSHEILQVESDIRAAARGIDLSLQQRTLIDNTIGTEKSSFESIEVQRNSIENRIISEKFEAQIYRKQIEDIKEEIEKYIELASNFKTNRLICESDDHQNIALVSHYENELIEIQNQIHKQKTMSDSLIMQRDMLKRKVQAEKDGVDGYDDEIKLFMSEIKHLKELIREKDLSCLQSHVQKEDVALTVTKLKESKEKIDNGLKEALLSHNTLVNTIMRTRYLSEIASNDKQHLEIEVERLRSELQSFEKTAHTKDYEAKLLREKYKVLQSTMKAVSSSYNDLIHKIKQTKGYLESELSTQKTLLENTLHYGHLQKEFLHIQRALLLEQGKVRALEDELEKPINVHRWRFLEATNPDLMQMIKMKQALQNTLTIKTEFTRRLNNRLNRIIENTKRAEKHISKSTTGEITDAIDFFEKMLVQKLQQLQQLQEQIYGTKPNVEVLKESVDVTREELRDTKSDLYEEKTKVDRIRMSNVVQKRIEERTHPTPYTEYRFIGGGFAISNPSRSVSMIDNAKTNNPLILPKVSSTKSPKLLPKGWNPSREPLKPFLPTVTSLVSDK